MMEVSVLWIYLFTDTTQREKVNDTGHGKKGRPLARWYEGAKSTFKRQAVRGDGFEQVMRECLDRKRQSTGSSALAIPFWMITKWGTYEEERKINAAQFNTADVMHCI